MRNPPGRQSSITKRRRNDAVDHRQVAAHDNDHSRTSTSDRTTRIKLVTHEPHRPELADPPDQLRHERSPTRIVHTTSTARAIRNPVPNNNRHRRTRSISHTRRVRAATPDQHPAAATAHATMRQRPQV